MLFPSAFKASCVLLTYRSQVPFASIKNNKISFRNYFIAQVQYSILISKFKSIYIEILLIK